MGFSPDLVWLIGELGSAPLAHHLSSSIVASGPDRRDRRWTIDDGRSTGTAATARSADRGRRSSKRTDGTHTLRCSYCALGWSLHVSTAACTAETPATISSRPRRMSTQPQRRVELCGACSGYTKVIDVARADAVSAARDSRTSRR